MLARARARTRTRGRGRGDRGAFVPLFAVLIVVLLVFLAFAVDIGAAYNERRQDQTAADAAALAAAQQLSVSSSAAAAAAMAVARNNLPTTYSDSEWTQLWSSCADPNRDPLQYPVVSAASPCISFNAGFTRVRVRLPTQSVGTNFAQVIGIKSISTFAGAEAENQPPAGGGVLPFGVMGFNSDVGNQVCWTVAGGCGGANSDTLRALDSPLVGNPQFGTSRTCRSDATFGDRIELNAAIGLDHQVVVYKSPPGERLDDCGVELPNTVYAQGLQGLKLVPFVEGVRKGVISGPLAASTYPDGKPARLRRIPSGFPGWQTRQLRDVLAGTTVTLDNRPLWEFIPTKLTSAQIPASCVRSNFNPGTKAKMQTCLADFNSGIASGKKYSPLFSARNPSNPPDIYDIQLSSRVAFIPSLPAGCCGESALTKAPIEAFNLAFIQTIYLNQADANAQFDPGEGGTGTISMPNFDGLSALRISDTMVPASVVQSGPNGQLRGARGGLIR